MFELFENSVSTTANISEPSFSIVSSNPKKFKKRKSLIENNDDPYSSTKIPPPADSNTEGIQGGNGGTILASILGEDLQELNTSNTDINNQIASTVEPLTGENTLTSDYQEFQMDEIAQTSFDTGFTKPANNTPLMISGVDTEQYDLKTESRRNMKTNLNENDIKELAFKQFIDDATPEIKICGKSFPPSNILKLADPKLYDDHCKKFIVTFFDAQGLQPSSDEQLLFSGSISESEEEIPFDDLVEDITESEDEDVKIDISGDTHGFPDFEEMFSNPINSNVHNETVEDSKLKLESKSKGNKETMKNKLNESLAQSMALIPGMYYYIYDEKGNFVDFGEANEVDETNITLDGKKYSLSSYYITGDEGK